MTCPGDLLSGLVDGELDHAVRERVLSHLMHCAPCRAEIEVLRGLKARLFWSAAEPPLPAPGLTARLQAMAVPGVEPGGAPRPPAGSVRPVSVRPAGRSGPVRPRPTRLRRRTVGGCLVALGLGAAFLLGGQPTSRTGDVQVDPGTDQFVVDYVNATSEVPLTDPMDAAVVGAGR